jgi:hypothetical protein
MMIVSRLDLARLYPAAVPIVQRPRTWPFQGQNTGSNPVGDAIQLTTIFLITCRKPPRSIRGPVFGPMWPFLWPRLNGTDSTTSAWVQAGRKEVRQALAELFSGYRAEWLADRIFTLFTEPSYFPQLVTSDPCFLVGGRGTGKTTVLRSLSYEGLFALKAPSTAELMAWPYFGMYYRVNTNRVNAFQGPELPEKRWARLFAHYINLEFCDLVLRFLEWFAARVPDAQRLSPDALQRVALAFQAGSVANHGELARALESARISFEAAINNVGDSGHMPALSMQGAPIDQLLREVKALPQFAGKSLFFLVDEYENFDRLQQRVVNTLIKHCGELYTFKIGVREFGFRERSTLQPHEQLMHPADYKVIDIADELVDQGRFADFAADVCNVRLRVAFDGADSAPDVRALLPELDPEQEALLLGVEPFAVDIKTAAAAELAKDQLEWLNRLTPLETYMLKKRAEAESVTVAAKVHDAYADKPRWRAQYDNFKHAYLFTIRRRKRGIRKYFCGWNVFCHLAAGNIRFLLELVDEALTRQLADNTETSIPITPDNQTKAAQETGNKNLRELEGLALSGAKLARLLLGLGRVFQVMAEDPIGHTPEVNQFHLSSTDGDPEVRSRVDELLTEGVMHLALIRYRGSKLQEDSDIRQWDYAIHPIFAPFFGFSHRRKRKIELPDHELLGLVEAPSDAIKTILTGQHRTFEDDLPEQMQLFARYYAVSR